MKFPIYGKMPKMATKPPTSHDLKMNGPDFAQDFPRNPKPAAARASLRPTFSCVSTLRSSASSASMRKPRSRVAVGCWIPVKIKPTKREGLSSLQNKKPGAFCREVTSYSPVIGQKSQKVKFLAFAFCRVLGCAILGNCKFTGQKLSF